MTSLRHRAGGRHATAGFSPIGVELYVVLFVIALDFSIAGAGLFHEFFFAPVAGAALRSDRRRD